MIIPVKKIEILSFYDFHIINDNRGVTTIPNRINSYLNVVRVYYTDLDYNEIQLELDKPTLLINYGIILFPTSQSAILYARQANMDDEDISYSKLMSKIFNKVLGETLIKDGIQPQYVFDKPCAFESGIYSLKTFDDTLFYDYDMKYRDGVMVKDITVIDDTNELSIDPNLRNIITQIFTDDPNILTEYPQDIYRILIEIQKNDNNVYVKVIPVKTNGIKQTYEAIFLPLNGRMLYCDTSTINIIKYELERIFVLKIKHIINYSYLKTKVGKLRKVMNLLPAIGKSILKISGLKDSVLFIALGIFKYLGFLKFKNPFIED